MIHLHLYNHIRNAVSPFSILVVVFLIVGCTEKQIPEEEEPMINCVDPYIVNDWIRDTLASGYAFSYPPYLIEANTGTKIWRIFDNDVEPAAPNIVVKFGICSGITDPCREYLPYNATSEIFPPTSDTLTLRSRPYIKSSEVCQNEMLHGVLYYRLKNPTFEVMNGLFFLEIKDEDAFYIGGEFIFAARFLDDVIKMCESFVPLE